MPQFSLELKPSETVVLQMSGSTSKNYLSLFLSTAWIKPHATFSDYFCFSWNWLGNKQQRTIKPKRHLWRVVTPKLCPKARRQKLLSTFVLRKKTQRASLWRHQHLQWIWCQEKVQMRAAIQDQVYCELHYSQSKFKTLHWSQRS